MFSGGILMEKVYIFGHQSPDTDAVTGYQRAVRACGADGGLFLWVSEPQVCGGADNQLLWGSL